jgi:acyl-CoA synthetase (AMP-forming)/AMP-acid ligase II
MNFTAYAMTEYVPLSESFCKDINEYIPGNVGFISADTELKIIDLNSGQSLGPNIDGEICVRGSKMFSGYLNNESATQETIDKEGWLHTGDVGHYDQNERLFITDRLKEVIKIGVVTISPNEIEQFLLTHESVEEVAVVGVKHKTETQSPRAYVKVRKGTKVSEEELKKFVAGLNVKPEILMQLIYSYAFFPQIIWLLLNS